ncbi:hypothetical protein FEM08_00980 [Flavobacterium gilvum]|nr:hypothetical protein FEM08_00980 [Flavobacterium gilvum]
MLPDPYLDYPIFLLNPQLLHLIPFAPDPFCFLFYRNN